MHTLTRSTLPLLVLLSTACAGSRRQEPMEPQLSAEQQAHCTALADSILANVAREDLPEARPRGRPSRVRPPTNLTGPMRIEYLVRPDGWGDTSTVVVTGTDNARLRRDAVELARKDRMVVPLVNGCPGWSRVAIVIVPLGITREKSRH